MSLKSKPLLVIGYGNTARGDDGIAPVFMERLNEMHLPGVETRVDFQLQVEYAMELGDYRQLVFVDASMDTPAPFSYAPLTTDAERYFDTHSLSPAALVLLAETLFGARTPASILAIRGYTFQPFVEGLSSRAEGNVSQALAFLANAINGGTLASQ